MNDESLTKITSGFEKYHAPRSNDIIWGQCECQCDRAQVNTVYHGAQASALSHKCSRRQNRCADLVHTSQK